MKNSQIAIVGMACLYPDANSPQQLWENILSQRQAFREIPSERLFLADYFSSDKSSPDSIYSTKAAVIDGYNFDRLAFKVVGETYRAADITHWIALDIASQSLADAGFPQGENLPKETTGVLLGNTLTGEFSRANSLRLRWPYVKRVVEAQLNEQNISEVDRAKFLAELESRFKEPFTPIGDESLAGNLSNTIAGRISNHFDFKGGGYTIDGACSSSLLAIANACSSLVAGDLDVVLAGGVDISIDPFELVGFAKVGALSPDLMWVYDQRSQGFIPGEGCGFVVLMRYEDALEQQKRIYGLIRGWGISSDGKGGITRPEVEGQLLAVNRAYKRAGFAPDTVGFFEGHGTGTIVGDATELQVLTRACQKKELSQDKAALGSIKANIGHTKAAAGIASFIKATMAVYTQIIPPMTGCDRPNHLLNQEDAVLEVLKQGRIWSDDVPLRAGVSSMGFGGINTHIVLEGLSNIRRQNLTVKEQQLITSIQDAELILLTAQSEEDLQKQIEHLLTIVPRLSLAEIGDLATELAKNITANWPIRVALIASNPQELTNRLREVQKSLEENQQRENIFIGKKAKTPRIGFLFPGQAAPVYLDGGIWQRRFTWVKDLYEEANLPRGENNLSTDIAQPAIITASLAGLKILEMLNIEAELALGHSLGELCSLYWAGAYNDADLINLAKIRGQAMAKLGHPTGKMASIKANVKTVQGLINNKSVVIAGINSSVQTVISGEENAIIAVMNQAQSQGLKTVLLPVSHAFHSPLVASAITPLATYLQQYQLNPLQKSIISTVTGSKLPLDLDWQSLLLTQITSPVRFVEAVTEAAQTVDLFIEVGPGNILSRLVSDITEIPVMALDSGGESLQGLLKIVAQLFAFGVDVNYDALFKDRFTRPFNLDWQPQFLVNPCQKYSQFTDYQTKSIADLMVSSSNTPKLQTPEPELIQVSSSTSIIDYVKEFVAKKTELPVKVIADHHRLLGDLHLNSISVSQLVIDAARNLGLTPPTSPTDYSHATIADMAQGLEELAQNKDLSAPESLPLGVDYWLRTFTVNLIETPLKSLPLNNNFNHQDWEIIATADNTLAQLLKSKLTGYQGKGVIVCLSKIRDELQIELLLKGAKLALEKQSSLILIQHRGGYQSFFRTFQLENPQLITCVIDIPLNHPDSVDWIVTEITHAQNYTEVYYNSAGTRKIPQLSLLENLSTTKKETGVYPLTKDDLLLVTGGGKGIASECALSLAKLTGVKLVLLGRSKPENDLELANNLTRMQGHGINVKYFACDISNQKAVQEAITEINHTLGEITGILHGAGVNTPKSIKNLETEDFVRTLAPKVKGLQYLLTSVNPELLKTLITFGSIIARTGLPGEADYGLANQWLGLMVEDFQQQYPHCRCLNLEWSIWSGIGMGERLGRVDTLRQQGITPISPDEGIAILHSLLSQSQPSTSLVIAGRFGEPVTLKWEQPELPFLRFLEQKQVYYPGIELIVSAELSLDNDPYLQDHVYQGEYIFPGVMGLEAIAQVTTALFSSLNSDSQNSLTPLIKGEQIIFKSVKFNRPILVSAEQPLKIQIAALVTESDQIKAVIRSEQTGFSVDHFEAIVSYQQQEDHCTKTSLPFNPKSNNILNPEQHLYGELLFHGKRFQRIKKYSHLKATECIAQIKTDFVTPWFSRYLPQDLILGDTGARDAVIHALQACVPSATILPTGIEYLKFDQVNSSVSQFMIAQERLHHDNTFIYDLEVFDATGNLLEVWQGLELKVIKQREVEDSWLPVLLPTYLERQIKEVIPSTDLTLMIGQDLSSLLPITHRPDGKPELENHQAVSISHTDNLTFVVKGSTGCDVESVICRDRTMWRHLLGVRHFDLANLIKQETEEDFNIAATRVWCAKESLKKAGMSPDLPILFTNNPSPLSPCLLWLKSVHGQIATFVVSVRGFETPLVFAVLAEEVKESEKMRTGCRT